MPCRLRKCPTLSSLVGLLPLGKEKGDGRERAGMSGGGDSGGHGWRAMGWYLRRMDTDVKLMMFAIC